MIHAVFFNSKKEILAWDFKENQLVLLLSDFTVEHFLIDLNSEIPTLGKQTFLDSTNIDIKRPIIHINPSKSSFLLWEGISNGRTWLLVEEQKVDSYWCNINTSTSSVLICEEIQLTDADVFVGANTVTKTDPRISQYSFFVLGNTKENDLNQWLSIGTRTIDEKLFEKQTSTLK